MKKTLILTAAFLVTGLVGWQAGRATAQEGNEKPTLTEGAKKALGEAFPKGVVDKIEEEKASVKVFEVELKVDGKEASLVVAPDGTVMKKEMQVAADALPAAVKAAVEKETAGAKVLEIQKEEKLAVVKVVALDKPQTEYEVKMTKEGKTWEVELDAEGKVTKKKDVSDEAEEEK